MGHQDTRWHQDTLMITAVTWHCSQYGQSGLVLPSNHDRKHVTHTPPQKVCFLSAVHSQPQQRSQWLSELTEKFRFPFSLVLTFLFISVHRSSPPSTSFLLTLTPVRSPLSLSHSLCHMWGYKSNRQQPLLPLRLPCTTVTSENEATQRFSLVRLLLLL